MILATLSAEGGAAIAAIVAALGGGAGVAAWRTAPSQRERTMVGTAKEVADLVRTQMHEERDRADQAEAHLIDARRDYQELKQECADLGAELHRERERRLGLARRVTDLEEALDRALRDAGQPPAVSPSRRRDRHRPPRE